MAAEHSRYHAEGAESEFEPGSRRRVLRNLRGIRLAREMARAESQALYTASQFLIDHTAVDQVFTAGDICGIHKTWLGDIYPWAGEYRAVNIAKGDFMFAAAAQVPRLMDQMEHGPLRELTPCPEEPPDVQARALAVVHAELVLIHPFREGNGRCARLLAMLMGLQAGLPPLDFSAMEGRGKPRYIAAIHAALGRDYEPMTAIFRTLIVRAERANRD